MKTEPEIRDKLDRINGLMIKLAHDTEEAKSYVIDLLALLIGKGEDSIKTPEVKAWIAGEPSKLDEL